MFLVDHGLICLSVKSYWISCQWRRIFFGWRPNLQDEGDNHIIELAVASVVSTIITNNIRDFKMMELEFSDLKIKTPIQFLKEAE